MATSKTLLDDANSPGAGEWHLTRSAKRTVQVVITGTASVTIEGSNDGSNAEPLLTGITASSGYSDDAPWVYVRARVASITSGTVSVIMGE